jgi:tetraprenyl-beta-curcumene synthase
MAADRGGLATVGAAFLAAAWKYWAEVFPTMCRESGHWRTRAQEIPDPELRRLAIDTQRIKRGNIEGSVAFAAFAPASLRSAVVRAQVAFQSIYDYVDTLSEQAVDRPIPTARQLHQALLAPLEPCATHAPYYALYPHDRDGHYLVEMVDTCRSTLLSLPSFGAIAPVARRMTERIVSYQTLNLSERQGGQHELMLWAKEHTPPGTDMRWWETAASAGSSLGLFALMAAAAEPNLAHDTALAIERAYWPWIGALHSLLDSLVDATEDEQAEQRNLLHYYASSDEAVERMETLAEHSLAAIRPLPQTMSHRLVIAAMAAYYISSGGSVSPDEQQISLAVRDALGGLACAASVVFRLRRTASRPFRRHRCPRTRRREC